MSSLHYEQLCRRFSLDEILSATQNFDDALVIGQGGFGKVYKATVNVENGATVVAIKRLDSSSNQGAPEFWAEIEMLSKLRHCNLVSLIGYCNDNSEMILIYEFMPHGTLDDHLHKYGTSLSWVQRLKISIGAARGLHYLHTGTGTQHGVIHRDVKSSNILLDKDYAAKISDFGLSKIGPINRSATYVNTLIKGTFGYLDPEYFLTGRLTRKSDVFAFGVVSLELLCGRQAVDHSLDDEQCGLAKWAHECIEEGKLYQIVDFNIKGQIFPKCLKVFVQIADRCLCSRSKERPTMAEVVVALERSLSLQDKFDSHVRPAGILAFTKMMKGFFISPEINSAQSDTNPSKKNEVTIKCDPSSEEDSGDHHQVLPFGEVVDSLNHASAQRKTTALKDNVNHASLSKEDNDDHHDVFPVKDIQTRTHVLKVFSSIEIESATRNFMHRIRSGQGEFGEVFKGWVNEKTYFPSGVDAGLKIAVKKLCGSKVQHLLEAKSVDLSILTEFSHPNLVKLLGYCIEEGKLFLVHEFLENGSLDTHLFGGDKLPLQWKTRVKIAVGVAEGLHFLDRTQNQLNHWLSLQNILLDRDFNAKLSGFEVARLVHGNSYKEKIIDPLYFHPLHKDNLEVKGNAHDFGEVLIHILTGRRIISRSDLADVKEALNLKGEGSEEGIRKVLDPHLSNVDDPTIKYAVHLAALAFLCLEEPSYLVREALEYIRKLYTHMMKR